MAEIRTIAVISAGPTGRNITRLAALALPPRLASTKLRVLPIEQANAREYAFRTGSDPMTQLEIVRAGETDDDTVAAVSGVGGRMGCDITVTGDRVSTLPALTNA